MRRFGILFLVMVTAVILQTTVLARASLLGVTPDLILVAVISLALQEGPVPGVTAGFAGGLFRDLLLEAPKGVTALAYLIVGYVVGSVRPFVQSTSVLLPLAGVFFGSVMGNVLYVVVGILLGQESDTLARVLRAVFLSSIYNTIMVPFVYPLIRKLAGMYPREKIYRW